MRRRVCTAFSGSWSNITCQSGLRRNSSGTLVTSPWKNSRPDPDAMTNEVWPGVWPLDSTAVMPGATSWPQSYRVTLSARLEKILRLNPNDALVNPSGALLMLSSFIQNAQSTAGTLISAFGKASAPSDVFSPRIWSPCICEIRTMSTAFGSIPAAARVNGSSPTVGPRPGP
jgi:hypothetical protein